MNTFPRIIYLGFSLLLIACSSNLNRSVESASTRVKADWTLAPEESGMTFITIHSGDVAEINTFRSVFGTVTAAGAAEITINLNSVDSNDTDRDSMLRDVLFETDANPFARASAIVDMVIFNNLSVGVRHTELLDMTIDLHGIQLQQQFYVMVTRLSDDKVLIENKAPLLLDANDFAMGDALEQLRRHAELSEIIPVATITFSFVFERQ